MQEPEYVKFLCPVEDKPIWVYGEIVKHIGINMKVKLVGTYKGMPEMFTAHESAFIRIEMEDML